MTVLQFSFAPAAGHTRSRRHQIRSSADRQSLFNRIAPVYDNLNDVFSLGQHRIWKRMAVSWSGFLFGVLSQSIYGNSFSTPCGRETVYNLTLPKPYFQVGDIEAKEGSNVLDLCCGSGDLAFLLSQKVGLHGQMLESGVSTETAFLPLGVEISYVHPTLPKPYFRVIGLDFSREQLMVASSRQQLRSKACYRNLKWVEGDALNLPFPNCHFDAVTMGYGLRNVIDKYKAMKEVHRVLKPGSKASILDLNKSTDGFMTSIQGFVVDVVIVPVAAGYGLSEEYQYLKKSIQEFLTGKELEHLALEAGFSSAKHFEVGGGFMGNLVATR